MAVDPEGGIRASTLWAEPELVIDDESERSESFGQESASADQQIRILARANRLGLACDPATRHPGESAAGDVLDFPLRCVAHAHPDCRFRWVRVTLDLGGTAGASIQDLSPRDEVSEHPVKITTTYRGGLSFSISALPVSPELSAERTTEQDVFFPSITASGIGFSYAIWDFTAIGEAPLHVDRTLRMLATVPPAAAEVPVRLTLRASVSARGFLGRIPLVGRQTATIPLQHASG